MNTENFSNSRPVKAFDTAALAAAAVTTGLGIDTQGFSSLTIVVGAVITTGDISAISWEQSDDNGVTDAYAAVDDSVALYAKDLFPITGAGAKAIMAGTVAKKRWVRPILTTTGTVSIALQDCYGLLQDSYVQPNAVESSVLSADEINSPGATADAVTTPPKRTV